MRLVLDIMANLVDPEHPGLAGNLLRGGGRALALADPLLTRGADGRSGRPADGTARPDTRVTRRRSRRHRAAPEWVRSPPRVDRSGRARALDQPEAPWRPTLTDAELDRVDAYWRAANYLTVGQIYLQDNPLLREPLRPEHIKPRLLGHWGTSPGLNLIYAHLNRLIAARDLDVLFVCGPGHGGPAVVANVYLEGTWTEVYPDVGARRRRA